MFSSSDGHLALRHATKEKKVHLRTTGKLARIRESRVKAGFIVPKKKVGFRGRNKENSGLCRELPHF